MYPVRTGHYSVVMTERYAHLRPDLFSAKDLATIDIDLNAGEAELVPIRPHHIEITTKMPEPPCKPGR
jgi:hypothetical protein